MQQSWSDGKSTAPQLGFMAQWLSRQDDDRQKGNRDLTAYVRLMLGTLPHKRMHANIQRSCTPLSTSKQLH
ncbi:hypothetical protein cyc_05212 [Cyclospora cayetanensis]|uniref:Uncharacterized protein n=1 Tax=Cyclospora cayetanensis TaxID=88456 RepID=A0A1D3CSP9_9EIME|nr:hypothetical protein cyc_05212 [Cyclospora cayetanensis]